MNQFFSRDFSSSAFDIYWIIDLILAQSDVPFLRYRKPSLCFKGLLNCKIYDFIVNITIYGKL